MATITTENNLKIECAFVDGDTRTITLKNPRSDIETEEITELNSFIRDNQLLIGDETGAIFAKINKVKRTTTTIRTLDIA